MLLHRVVVIVHSVLPLDDPIALHFALLLFHKEPELVAEISHELLLVLLGATAHITLPVDLNQALTLVIEVDVAPQGGWDLHLAIEVVLEVLRVWLLLSN